MEIKWTNEAIESLRDNLNYWTNRNFSSNYSNKIIDEEELVIIKFFRSTKQKPL